MISAAGPLFTIIQAFVFYAVIKKTGNPQWYPFLLTPFIMRLLAMGISFFNANDEARISEWAGLGLFTIPLLVCMLLFFTLLAIRKKIKTPGILFGIYLIMNGLERFFVEKIREFA